MTLSSVPNIRTSVLIVLGCAIGMATNFATIFSTSMAAFIKPITSEFGWSRTEMISGYSAALFALAISSSPIGLAIDRFSARTILLLSIPAFGAAVASMAFIPDNLPIYILLCICIGLFGSGCFNFVYISILPRWFGKRLGLALGISVAGSGLGAAFVPPFAQHLIETFGWRNAYLVLGATAVATAWPVAFLALRMPGTGPRLSLAQIAASPADPSVLLRQVLRTTLFWRLAACYFLLACMANAHVIHLIPLLTDRGMSPRAAADYMTVFGISVVMSRICGGYLLDLCDAGMLGSAVAMFGVLGVGILLTSSAPVQLVLAVALIGMSVGAEGDVVSYILRRLFGVDVFGSLNGIMFTVILTGFLIGPMIMSLSFDNFGSYAPAQYTLLTGAMLAALGHFGVMRGRSVREPDQSVPS